MWYQNYLTIKQNLWINTKCWASRDNLYNCLLCLLFVNWVDVSGFDETRMFYILKIYETIWQSFADLIAEVNGYC